MSKAKFKRKQRQNQKQLKHQQQVEQWNMNRNSKYQRYRQQEQVEFVRKERQEEEETIPNMMDWMKVYVSSLSLFCIKERSPNIINYDNDILPEGDRLVINHIAQYLTNQDLCRWAAISQSARHRINYNYLVNHKKLIQQDIKFRRYLQKKQILIAGFHFLECFITILNALGGIIVFLLPSLGYRLKFILMWMLTFAIYPCLIGSWIHSSPTCRTYLCDPLEYKALFQSRKNGRIWRKQLKEQYLALTSDSTVSIWMGHQAMMMQLPFFFFHYSASYLDKSFYKLFPEYLLPSFHQLPFNGTFHICVDAWIVVSNGIVCLCFFPLMCFLQLVFV